MKGFIYRCSAAILPPICVRSVSVRKCLALSVNVSLCPQIFPQMSRLRPQMSCFVRSSH